MTTQSGALDTLEAPFLFSEDTGPPLCDAREHRGKADRPRARWLMYLKCTCVMHYCQPHAERMFEKDSDPLRPLVCADPHLLSSARIVYKELL